MPTQDFRFETIVGVKHHWKIDKFSDAKIGLFWQINRVGEQATKNSPPMKGADYKTEALTKEAECCNYKTSHARA